MEVKEYKTLAEFYPYYLSEHSKKGTRITHFLGTTLFFILLIGLFITKNIYLLIPTIVVPYAFAWVGHFFIESNKPATFKYPFSV